MPPKRRAGLKRIDASVDALTPMGFPPNLIRRKVKSLLKAYGEDGWVFIEEAAYKMLIEFILEEQEQCEQGEPSSRDSQIDEVRDQGGGEAEQTESMPLTEGSRDQGGCEAEQSEATPLIEGSEPTWSNLDVALATPITARDAPLDNPSLELKPTTSHVRSPRKIAPSNEVTRTDAGSIYQEPIAFLSQDCTSSAPPGFKHFSQMQLDSAPSNNHSLERRPCLGWMDPDDDDQSFILLEPAPVLGWETRKRPGKRKSRWDIPGDDAL